mmetsp:Transcript_92108/g.237694  ORF Transcript_92108/g.237694 Transcript_92108/m.237694 type:complete len:244 (+) Transcript_92108:2658-3389(+)
MAHDHAHQLLPHGHPAAQSEGRNGAARGPEAEHQAVVREDQRRGPGRLRPLGVPAVDVRAGLLPRHGAGSPQVRPHRLERGIRLQRVGLQGLLQAALPLPAEELRQEGDAAVGDAQVPHRRGDVWRPCDRQLRPPHPQHVPGGVHGRLPLRRERQVLLQPLGLRLRVPARGQRDGVPTGDPDAAHQPVARSLRPAHKRGDQLLHDLGQGDLPGPHVNADGHWRRQRRHEPRGSHREDSDGHPA